MATAAARAEIDDAIPAAETIRVTVARSDPAAPRHFEVPAAAPMILIDVLAALQRDADPSLAFRYSCRGGRCGTCTVRLNGVPVLACQISVEGAAELLVEPLGGLPVVHDLVIDTSPFFARWRDALLASAPSDTVTPSSTPAGAARDCIVCGACFAACPVSSAAKSFWGPAALTRLAVDGVADDARRLPTSGSHGVGGCHSVGACSIVCPCGLDPATVIRSLRGGRRRRIA